MGRFNRAVIRTMDCDAIASCLLWTLNLIRYHQMNKNSCWNHCASHRVSPRVLTLLFAGVCATLVDAQPSPSVAAMALQSVVVSGSRNEQQRDDLPLSMDVLTRADLEDGQIADIRDVAKGLPNVSVKRAPARFTVTGVGNSTGRDGNAGFNVRGQDGNRVLMLVDGIRLPRSYINGNNAFGRDALALDLVKRVELIRGPSSVLYGSDGLAGLVNFITYEPADFLTNTDGSSKTLGGKLALNYGGDDHGVSLAATVAMRPNDTLQWLLTSSTYHARGLNNMGSNDAANVDRSTPNPQADTGASLLGKLVLQPSATQKHVLTLESVKKSSDVELLSSRAKAPITAASVVAESASKVMRRERLTWDAHYTLAQAWADHLQTVLSRQSSATQDNGNTVRKDNGVRVRDTSYDERAWQVNVQADKTWLVSTQWSQKVTYGVDYASTDISSWFDGSDPAPLPHYVPKKYFPDTRDRSTALYAQSELINAHWRITPGLRLEQFDLHVLTQTGFAPPSPLPGKSLTGSNVSPKLGALYRLTPQWSVFGNYASGFRAPNAAQVNGFTENPTPSTFVTLLPNPDLKPETSQNLEFGLRARLDQLNLDMAVFSGNFHHLIVDKKPLGGTGTVGDPLLFQTINIDNARIQGFEIKGTVDWGALRGATVSTPFSYGRTRGVDLATDRPLNAINPAKLTMGIMFDTAQWNARLDATHHAAKNAADLDSPYLPKPANPPRIEQLTLPAATTLDLHLQWRARKDLRATLGLVNLGNRKYWLWSDVQGLAATSSVIDAYSQPGRHLNLSLVADF